MKQSPALDMYQSQCQYFNFTTSSLVICQQLGSEAAKLASQGTAHIYNDCAASSAGGYCVKHKQDCEPEQLGEEEGEEAGWCWHCHGHHRYTSK